MKSLGDLLRTALPTENDWKVKLLNSWDTVMGGLGTKVRLEKIENETLILGVADACWMQELYLLTPILLIKINQSMDRPRIKQLRFKRAGTYYHSKNTRRSKQQPIIHKNRALTPREERVLDRLSDQGLRDALLSFLQRCSREKL